MSEPLLLQAFRGTNSRVPVWFMRQAGRYLPEYQHLKKNLTLEQMFRTPEVAAQITLLPFKTIDVDAAILFADILTLPSQMGFKIRFVNGRGPVIDNPLKQPADVKKMHSFQNLDYVGETIQLVRHSLPAHISLIGFAGGPWTVLTYLLADGSVSALSPATRLALEHPQVFHAAMHKITSNTIDYLKLQKSAGIDVFQIFDTWAGILGPRYYRQWVLPYIRKIFEKVNLPSIYYLKNCAHLLPEMESSGADFLSVCETVELGNNPFLHKTKCGVQGNLFNGLLYTDENFLKREVQRLLKSAALHHRRYIFNLSHGVLPDVDPGRLKLITDMVHRFPWKKP